MENTALAPVVPGDEQAYLAMISEQFRSNTTSDKDMLPRVRIERENLENDNGDILMPAGCFSIDDPASGGRIYAKDIGFRYFMHYYRYKRYDAHAQRLTRDGDTAIGAYIHSVLVKVSATKRHLTTADFNVVDPWATSATGRACQRPTKSSSSPVVRWRFFSVSLLSMVSMQMVTR